MSTEEGEKKEEKKEPLPNVAIKKWQPVLEWKRQGKECDVCNICKQKIHEPSMAYMAEQGSDDGLKILIGKCDCIYHKDCLDNFHKKSTAGQCPSPVCGQNSVLWQTEKWEWVQGYEPKDSASTAGAAGGRK